MYKSIKMKAGSTTNSPGLKFDLTPITVFVGPNNSGKSLALREIEAFSRIGAIADARMIDSIEFSDKKIDADEFLAIFGARPNAGEVNNPEFVYIQSRIGRSQLHLNSIRQASNVTNVQFYCQAMLTHYTIRLDGAGRIGLCAQQAAGDMQAAAINKLAQLFRNNERRKKIRKIVYDAIGLYLVVDPTNLGVFKLRLSDRAPKDELEERGIHAEAVEFHSKALDIDLSSDGIKAFVGILVEVFMGDPQLIMIDEPEAFLHPSLASKLGKEIALAAQAEGKTVFVSTHSPAFLMGCIESHVPVNIVRCTYSNRTSTARLLDSSTLLTLMRNPLLRSTNVLDALFYQNVVVAESDSDRAFYQQINERLIRFSPERSLNNCLFINAQNKQTVPTIVSPLRALGISAAAVVDIDVFKCHGAEWTKFAAACAIPVLVQSSVGTARDAIEKAMIATGKDMKRDGGIDVLKGNDRSAAEGFLNDMAQYGLFIVPGGELESWLKQLGATGHGPFWLIKIFESIGDDPDAAEYVRPIAGDVWDFIASWRRWSDDPSKKGIPG